MIALDGTAAVGYRQAIQAQLVLAMAHRRVTRADRHESVDLRLIKEDVDLLGPKDLGDKITGLVERRARLGLADRKQLTQGVEETPVAREWIISQGHTCPS